MTTFGPSEPEFFEFGGPLRMFRGQVVPFGAIRGQIVKLPRASPAEADQLPVAAPNGGVTFVLPEEGPSLERFV